MLQLLPLARELSRAKFILLVKKTGHFAQIISFFVTKLHTG